MLTTKEIDMKSFRWGRRWISKLKQSLVPKASAHQQQQKEMTSTGVIVTTLSDHLSFTPKSLGYYITNDPQPPRHSYCGGEEDWNDKRESDYYSFFSSKKECRWRGVSGRVHGLFRSRSERVHSTGAGICEENLHVPELNPIQTGRKDDDLIRKKIKRKKRVKVNSPRLVQLNNSKKKEDKKKKISRKTKNLESFAVVKDSMDPQEDFRNSMIEMILEIKMARREEFESLLDCYLALNGEEYHDVIVKAFREVWFVLYPVAPTTITTTSSSSSSNL